MQQEVKETGMIFQPHGVHAISDGRKTQTRRVVKHKLESDVEFAHEDGGGNWIFWSGAVAPNMEEFTKKAYPNGEGVVCPYGRRDDLIYVKESVWAYSGSNTFHYSADEQPPIESGHFGWLWHAHQMPKNAARLGLAITNVRVQRVQEISEADAISEGMRWHGASRAWSTGADLSCYPTAKEAFAHGWDPINAKRVYSWELNPLVWVLEFKKL